MFTDLADLLQNVVKVGDCITVSGKKFTASFLSFFVIERRKKEEWYVFFRESDQNKNSSFVVNVRDIKKLKKRIRLEPDSLPHKDDLPQIGGIYEHFKGRDYEVLEVAYNPIEERWFVCYKTCHTNVSANSFVRTVDDFTSFVLKDNIEVEKFTLVK